MSDFEFKLPAPGGADGSSWITVEGGGLPQPLAIKFRLAGAELRIVGLRIDNDQEITSSALRSVRLGELAEALFAALWEEIQDLEWTAESHRRWLEAWGVDDQQQASLFVEGFDPDAAGASGPEYDNYWGMMNARSLKFDLTTWLNLLQVDADSEVAIQRRTPGAKPPTANEYKAFARAYLEELTGKARGAKTRTAARLGMDRGTVYRWIKECQERGYLPQEGGQHG